MYYISPIDIMVNLDAKAFGSDGYGAKASATLMQVYFTRKQYSYLHW
jgi:hypothetical protein